MLNRYLVEDHTTGPLAARGLEYKVVDKVSGALMAWCATAATADMVSRALTLLTTPTERPVRVSQRGVSVDDLLRVDLATREQRLLAGICVMCGARPTHTRGACHACYKLTTGHPELTVLLTPQRYNRLDVVRKNAPSYEPPVALVCVKCGRAANPSVGDGTRCLRCAGST